MTTSFNHPITESSNHPIKVGTLEITCKERLRENLCNKFGPCRGRGHQYPHKASPRAEQVRGTLVLLRKGIYTRFGVAAKSIVCLIEQATERNAVALASKSARRAEEATTETPQDGGLGVFKERPEVLALRDLPALKARLESQGWVVKQVWDELRCTPRWPWRVQ